MPELHVRRTGNTLTVTIGKHSSSIPLAEIVLGASTWQRIYDDALAGIETELVRGVEWRIKQSTKVFREPDPHRGNLVHRHAGRVTLHESLQIVRRATIGRDLISADLLNAHLNDWGVYGRDSGRVEFLDERRRRAVGKNKANQFDAEKLVNAVRVRMPDPAAFSARRPEASLLRRCLEDRR